MSRTRRRVLETILNLLQDTKEEHERSRGAQADLQHAGAPHSLPNVSVCLCDIMHTIFGFIINISYVFLRNADKGSCTEICLFKEQKPLCKM